MTPSPGWTRVHAAALGATFGWAAMTGNEWPLLVTAVVLFAVWIWVARQRWTPQGRFGPANAITAVRFALVLVVAALPAAWIVPWAGIAIAVFFTLDGVDGLVAHRTNSASEFGAEFDTETDAFMVAVACLVVVELGLLGPWVFAVGALRYALMVSASLSRAGPEPRRTLARWAFSALMSGLAGALIVPHTITVAVLAAGSLAVIVSFVRSFWWSFGPGPR